jgi:hypothetical protein
MRVCAPGSWLLCSHAFVLPLLLARLELGGKHSSPWRRLAWVEHLFSFPPISCSVATQRLRRRVRPVSASFRLLLTHAVRVV